MKLLNFILDIILVIYCLFKIIANNGTTGDYFVVYGLLLGAIFDIIVKIVNKRKCDSSDT